MAGSTASLLMLSSAALLCAQSYTYDVSGRLTGIRYNSGSSIQYTYDKAGNLVRRVAGASGGPVLSAAGVVNAASFKGGAVAAGEIVTLFGTGIGPSVLAGLSIGRPGFLDTLVAQTAVSFDGVRAPLVYVSAGQSSAIVPYSVAGKATTQITVEYQGARSAAITIPVSAAAPALFSSNSSGTGPGAILNQDGGVNSPSNPADKGSVVVLFGTGEGQTDPSGTDGALALSVFPKPVLPASVAVAGRTVELLYFGAAPSLVAGVFQANIRIPSDAASGNLPVIVTVGNTTSPAGITVSVR